MCKHVHHSVNINYCKVYDELCTLQHPILAHSHWFYWTQCTQIFRIAERWTFDFVKNNCMENMYHTKDWSSLTKTKFSDTSHLAHLEKKSGSKTHTVGPPAASCQHAVLKALRFRCTCPVVDDAKSSACGVPEIQGYSKNVMFQCNIKGVVGVYNVASVHFCFALH